MYERMEHGGFVNVNHIHPYQSELILIVEGSVTCYLEVQLLRTLISVVADCVG